ncbi:S-adenosyl-L-methionine-dependent methyltransferase [Phycomyces nitens]|nr:S-adenosyl-L-methionine-dependent methyltransferase [Phycomyces nitens]
MSDTEQPVVDQEKAKHQRQRKTDTKKKPVSKKKEKAQQREHERLKAATATFNRFYENEFGPERWPLLLEAMKKPVRHCMMMNKYAHPEDVLAKLAPMKDDLRSLDFLSIPCYASTLARFPHPSKDRANITDCYILDAGSVLATEALDIQPHDRVLDLCAAPGGKSLAILQRLSDYGNLTVNEISPDRRRRLRQVMDNYVPPKVSQENVNVLGKDGTRFYHDPEQYDKVLLDAPCSSERHLLHDEKEFEQWTPKRTIQNAKRQLSLLKAASYSVNVGGYVVYGTCSISSAENDKVVDRMVRKGKVPMEVVPMSWPMGEKTENGWIILPDRSDGWGPLYFSLLRRTGVSKEGEWNDDEDDDDEEEEEKEEKVKTKKKSSKNKK